MKPRRSLLLALAFLVATAASAFGQDTRFSQNLTIGERAEVGFNRLNSDQVAVLDALVRRDLATKSSSRSTDKAPPARFSERLTAMERTNAGLAIFSEKELVRLDALVEQNASAALARTLLAPPVFYPTGMRLRPVEPLEPRTGREIHGSFMLSYGFGKGGYSEKTGGITLNYEDPVHNFAVSFSYTESHIKGGIPYRDDSLRDGYPTPSPLVP